MSREENKKGDELDKYFSKNALFVMMIVVIIITGVVYFVEFFVNKVWRHDLFVISNSAIAAGYIYSALKIKRKLYIASAVIFSAISIMWLIRWILQLCGVM